MFDNIMGAFNEAQQQMDSIKKKLDDVIIEEQAENGLVKVKITGNKKVQNIEIGDDLIEAKDKEAIEDLLITALNKAIEKADKTYEQEMQNMAGNLLPGLGDFMK